MSEFLLSAYVLIWPVLVAVILGIIVKGFVSDWMAARRDQRDLI